MTSGLDIFIERVRRVDWRDLELFLQVAEAGSLRRGAAVTRHSISTIRRRLARIEDLMGGPLADRAPHGLVLTPAGERLAAVAGQMRATRDLGDVPAGAAPSRDSVTIAVTEGLGTYWLIPRLVEFQARHPELDVQLNCEMRANDVAGGESDIAVQLDCPAHSGVQIERIGCLHLMPFASERYLRKVGIPRSIDEWPDHRIVWQEADQVASHLLPYIMGPSASEELIALRTNSSSAHFRAIASGGGIGILPTYARAVSRRVRPVDVGIHVRREILCVINCHRANAAGVMHAAEWLRESFDGLTFPWFAEDFVHPGDFDETLASPNVLSLFEGFIDPHGLGGGTKTDD